MTPGAAYYNEIDPYAATWLRNLIAAGHIAPGDVDERSIEDVHPNDLRNYTQCHFFAGIGVWSYALRLAGWPDDRPVWTGSCPCQPFSAAGKGTGFDDERHLWPAWHWLIQERRPPAIFGEQVASKDAEPWLDLVFTDLEAMDYACGATPFPAAGIGAPHIRDRLYWMAHADNSGLERRVAMRQRGTQCFVGPSGLDVRLADSGFDGRNQGRERIASIGSNGTLRDGSFIGMADAQHHGRDRQSQNTPEPDSDGANVGILDRGHSVSQGQPPAGPTNGHWRAADWLLCRDGKWRPVEPGTFPLVDGSAGRVGRVRADQERLAALLPRKDQGSRAGRLRAYGNAIVAQAAATFIQASMT